MSQSEDVVVSLLVRLILAGSGDANRRCCEFFESN